MDHDVFVSYSQQDKAAAELICSILEEHRVRVWIASRDVRPGTQWTEEIMDAIGTCRVMVLVFSKYANNSPHIAREVELAIEKCKVVVPLRIEDVQPTQALEYWLKGQQWLDAWPIPFPSKSTQKLVATVIAIIHNTPVPTPLNQPLRPVAERIDRVGQLETTKPSRVPRTQATYGIWWMVLALGVMALLVLVAIRDWIPSAPTSTSGDKRFETGNGASERTNSVEAKETESTTAPFDSSRAHEFQEFWARKLGVKPEFENKSGIRFRLIPPGKFSTPFSRGDIERMTEVDRSFDGTREELIEAAPGRRQHVRKAFYMSVNEITWGHWKPIPGGTVNQDKQQTEKHPAGNVPFIDAVKFCNALCDSENVSRSYSLSPDEAQVSLVSEDNYRLPTEAEWEWACCAGTEATWSSGNDESQLADFARFAKKSSDVPQPVGVLKPNSFGLFDMHGNVAEWCFGNDPSSKVNFQVLRGGDYSSTASSCESGSRWAVGRGYRTAGTGIRIVVATNISLARN